MAPYAVQQSSEEIERVNKNPVAAALEAAMKGKMAYQEAQEFKVKQEMQTWEAYKTYRMAGLGHTQAAQRARIRNFQPTEDDSVGIEKKKATADLEHTKAGTENLKAQGSYYKSLSETGAGIAPATAATPADQPPKPAAISATEAALKPTDLKPGQALIESGARAFGRMTRSRETQKALEESYQAKTAAAARGLGDTANVAVEERKMLAASFPKDGDTYESRSTMEGSMNSFFDKKEAELQQAANQAVPLVLIGQSKSGPRYGQDSTVIASKKKAQEGLLQLRQTRALYQQIYSEAAEKMPPIGSEARQTPSVTQEQRAAYNAARAQGMSPEQARQQAGF